MRAPRKTYICSKCKASATKFAGYCASCNAAGTMKEQPTVEKPRATPSQKSLMRRSKNSERNIARRMKDIDGEDPAWSKISSSTGRVGHLTGLQFDAISRRYVIENKNRLLPLWLIKAWVQILQKGADFDKHALLHLEPPNLPREFPVNGTKRKTDTMALIQQTRHEDLIRKEQKLDAVNDIMQSGESNIVRVRKIMDILGS